MIKDEKDIKENLQEYIKGTPSPNFNALLFESRSRGFKSKDNPYFHLYRHYVNYKCRLVFKKGFDREYKEVAWKLLAEYAKTFKVYGTLQSDLVQVSMMLIAEICHPEIMLLDGVSLMAGTPYICLYSETDRSLEDPMSIERSLGIKHKKYLDEQKRRKKSRAEANELAAKRRQKAKEKRLAREAESNRIREARKAELESELSRLDLNDRFSKRYGYRRPMTEGRYIREKMFERFAKGLKITKGSDQKAEKAPPVDLEKRKQVIEAGHAKHKAFEAMLRNQYPQTVEDIDHIIGLDDCWLKAIREKVKADASQYNIDEMVDFCQLTSMTDYSQVIGVKF